jgi:RNA polymerase sigma-70 factor, ECF subfamily
MLDALDRPASPEPAESWLDGLHEALAELPEGQRQAIELRVVEDLDYDGVAKRLDTTPAAARVRVHRGLSALRNLLTNSMEAQ